MKSLHLPKKLNSTIGLGLSSLGNKSEYIGNNVIITTKVWEQLEEPWREGETIIAQEGYKWVTRWELDKTYLITTIFNENNELIGIYCDICSPITREGISFTCYDWYLDVWKEQNNPPIILDEDELNAAREKEYLSINQVQQAKAAAHFLIELLKTKK